MLREFQQAFQSSNKLFVDHGFFSTTVIMDSFRRSDSIDLVVKVPKGRGRGAYIRHLSKYPRENEFLLNNHSVFSVDNIKQVDGRWQVELTWKIVLLKKTTHNQLDDFNLTLVHIVYDKTNNERG